MKVTVTNPENLEVKSFYIDDGLKRLVLDPIKDRLSKKDKDYVCIVDGEEGSGKSVLAMQIAKYIDPTFSLDRVCFSPKQFRDAILNAKKGQCVVFDEAYRGLSGRGALSAVNKMLIQLMTEMRQKNLFVIIVLPTFYLLEKYIAIWRARSLFHVYEYNDRHLWRWYSKKNKKFMYLKGKKDYGYGYARHSLKGTFFNTYTVDEQTYRKKKDKSFKEGFKKSRASDYMLQRNKLLWAIHKEFDFTQTELASFCKEHGVTLSQNRLSEIFQNFTSKK